VGKAPLPVLGSRLGNRKRFIVATGFAERLFRCSPIAIPLLCARHFSPGRAAPAGGPDATGQIATSEISNVSPSSSPC